MKSKYLLFTLLVVLTIMASACSPQATPTSGPASGGGNTSARSYSGFGCRGALGTRNG